jgi:hypothetical protein
MDVFLLTGAVVVAITALVLAAVGAVVEFCEWLDWRHGP